MNSRVAATKRIPDMSLRGRLNITLLRVMNLEVENKPPEEISLAEVFGNMDAGGYLILLLSLLTVLGMGFLSGMLLLSIWPNANPSLAYIGVIPGAAAGYCVYYCLFRIRRLLRS